MEIIVAKTAGFCFGVNNALNLIESLLKRADGLVYTIGPVIHNDQVVEKLASRGVRVIDSAGDVDVGGTVVIRTHGVSPEVYRQITARDLKLVDATCPYVKKIHQLVREKYAEGYQIVIAGDRTHPEVEGINGWCENSAYIAKNADDLNDIANDIKKVCAVAQTTMNVEEWTKIGDILNKKFENLIKFDTICYTTGSRQDEAEKIARSVDMMIVIGGRNSSNTQKLYEICRKYCQETHKIETSGDLPPVDINKIKKIGITAGASTPDWVIKEVIEKMDELNRQDEEMSFKEAFEGSLVSLKNGEVVKGRIIGFNNTEVYVDMGYKSDGIIPMTEYSDDTDFKPEESIKIGDEVDVFIVRVNDGEGNVILSKKKVDTIKSWDKIEEAYENKTPLKARVTDTTNGGLLANVDGVRIFVPASQISDKYVKDLKEYLKQVISVRIIEYNKQKRKVVGSQRLFFNEQRSRMENEIWNNIEVNKKYTGTVKSLTDFGAFVDIGGVDGLIHISELSWSKIRHPSEVMKVGDTVEVNVLEFDREKKRISLGYRKLEDNPWLKAFETYKVGDVVKGRVVRLVPFGAFVELESGVDGLVHISQISNNRIAKPGDVLEIGQTVEAKVIETNFEAKKISLSIKEVSPIEPKTSGSAKAMEEETDMSGVPAEHKEELADKIGDITGGIINAGNNGDLIEDVIGMDDTVKNTDSEGVISENASAEDNCKVDRIDGNEAEGLTD